MGLVPHPAAVLAVLEVPQADDRDVQVASLREKRESRPDVWCRREEEAPKARIASVQKRRRSRLVRRCFLIVRWDTSSASWWAVQDHQWGHDVRDFHLDDKDEPDLVSDALQRDLKHNVGPVATNDGKSRGVHPLECFYRWHFASVFLSAHLERCPIIDSRFAGLIGHEVHTDGDRPHRALRLSSVSLAIADFDVEVGATAFVVPTRCHAARVGNSQPATTKKETVGLVPGRGQRGADQDAHIESIVSRRMGIDEAIESDVEVGTPRPGNGGRVAEF